MGSLRVRYQYTPGSSLAASIERLADGFNYDFADSTFKNTTPTTLTASLAADSLRTGAYKLTLASIPSAQFANGDYAVYIHDAGLAHVVDVLGAKIYSGDDATVFPSGSGTDPLGVDLTPYATDNTLGKLAKNLVNLDAAISGEPAAAAAAIFAHTTEGTLTFDELLRGLASAMLANVVCPDAATTNLRDFANGKNRVVATTDSSGNRTITSIDLT